MTENQDKEKQAEPENKELEPVIISRQEYDELKKKSEEAKLNFDKFLRLQAEFENSRKRVEKERIEFMKFAEAAFILELIPIVEDFDRALASANKRHDLESLEKGIKIIGEHLRKLLNRKGLKEIEAVGRAFDPDVHEALMHEDNKDCPDGTVIEELQKGYYLGDKVLRHAKVKISKKPEIIK